MESVIACDGRHLTQDADSQVGGSTARSFKFDLVIEGSEVAGLLMRYPD
jgi:hypothetical protein